MKRLFSRITLSLLALAVISTLMTSCEQEAIISPTDSEVIKDVEGFKSTTGNTDTPVVINEDEALEPLFKMSFSGDMPREEVEEQWAQAVENYMCNNVNNSELEDRDFSTEWFFGVITRTGTQTDNGTDGRVYSSVIFNTSKGRYATPHYKLEQSNGQLEEGRVDVFFFRTYIPGEAVEWVEAEDAFLFHRGTDGWFVKGYAVLTTFSQSIPSSGYTRVSSHPNVWLDNPTSSQWDYYNTGPIGTGRLEF